MKAAHDVYAETNPAFCAAVLARFCESYCDGDGQDLALSVAYLVLPIALSDDLAETFEGCNKNTGMLVWIERSPRIIANISSRINGTLQITTDAVRFGCITGVLRLASDGRLASGNKTIPSSAIQGSSGSGFKRAYLLGNWFAGAGSARAVLEAFGVSV